MNTCLISHSVYYERYMVRKNYHRLSQTTSVDEKLRMLSERIDTMRSDLMEKLDWLVGAFKKFDEEHTLLSGRLSDHEDRLVETEEQLANIRKHLPI